MLVAPMSGDQSVHKAMLEALDRQNYAYKERIKDLKEQRETFRAGYLAEADQRVKLEARLSALNARCRCLHDPHCDCLAHEARLAALTAALERLIASFELTLSEQGHYDHARQTDPDTMCLDCWEVREAQAALDTAGGQHGSTTV